MGFSKSPEKDGYIELSPHLVFTDAIPDFAIYLKTSKNNYVPYTFEGNRFTEKHKDTLEQSGVETVFLKSTDANKYENYLEENLGLVLSNDHLTFGERSRIFYQVSTTVVEEAFSSKLPQTFGISLFSRIHDIVKASIDFFMNMESLKAVSSIISHHYETYTHSTNVMVYAISILSSYDLDKDDVLQGGIGSILHDVGKAQIDKSILGKTDPLTDAEWELIKKHPLYGIAATASIPIDHRAINCILMHHEKCNGTGYPAGLTKASIPLLVKAVTIADVYDAITTDRPYAKAETPYMALQIMGKEMKGCFDEAMFKKFILILSGAEIIK